MRNWHSFFEILRYPLEIVFLASILLGVGNIATNPVFGIVYFIDNETVIQVFNMIKRVGQYLIVNFPILFMIRLSARKGAAGTTMISSLAGYIAFLSATLFFTNGSLPSTAYSSILGLSTGSGSNSGYPLQTGLVGIIIVVSITLLCYNWSTKRNEYGIYSFITNEAACTIATIILCFISGIVISYVWPYLVYGIMKLLSFIANDTTNPVNLTLYGILDGLLNTLGLGTMIRQPFWYDISGGSWINAAGAAITGDVSIWSAQTLASSVSGMTGRFITPYYVLNIFAVPAMVWSMYSLYTDSVERRRKRMLAITVTVVSIFSGTLLPLQLLLFVLSPLLFLFHIGYTGILFGVLQALKCYIGYNCTTNLTVSALPGSLPELMLYIKNPAFSRSMMILGIVGVVTAVVYFVAVRIYFRYLAIDLFKTGDTDRLVNNTIRALGGIENVKMTYSSICQLTVQVYDPTLVDTTRLKRLGSFRVLETRAGFRLCYGAGSVMVMHGINSAMRDSIKSVVNAG